MRVHWTDRAKTRLRLIQQYIAEDSPQVALKVVDRVTARSQQLSNLPHSGRLVREYNRDLTRFSDHVVYMGVYVYTLHSHH